MAEKFPTIFGKKTFSAYDTFDYSTTDLKWSDLQKTLDDFLESKDFSLSWHVGARHSFSFYDGEIQYNFQIDQEKTPFRLPVFAAATYKISNREVRFYRGKGCIVGEFTSNGYLVRVTVRGYDKLEDISFDHILWHEPQPH